MPSWRWTLLCLIQTLQSNANCRKANLCIISWPVCFYWNSTFFVQAFLLVFPCTESPLSKPYPVYYTFSCYDNIISLTCVKKTHKDTSRCSNSFFGCKLFPLEHCVSPCANAGVLEPYRDYGTTVCLQIAPGCLYTLLWYKTSSSEQSASIYLYIYIHTRLSHRFLFKAVS